MASNVFIEKVNLKGYRTIDGLKMTLNKDLNILIGPNGAGKSNFLKALFDTIRFDVKKHSNFKGVLDIRNSKDGLIKFEIANKVIKRKKNVLIYDTDNQSISSNVIKGEIKGENNKKLNALIYDNKVFYLPIFIRHGIPNEYSFVKSIFNFTIDKSGFSEELGTILTSAYYPQFVKQLCIMIFLSLPYPSYLKYNKEGEGIEKLKDNFKKEVDQFLEVKKYLTQYTKIEDIRLNENFTIQIDKIKEFIHFKNLFLEFKLNGQWLSFDNLSDGTRRLFYIISDITCQNPNSLNSKTFYLPHSGGFWGFHYDNNDYKKVVLLEEPELGLHPAQLNKLLLFIREFSETHQFIITTHSPQVLDMLEPDELHKIFKVSLDNGRTKVKKLTKTEIKKAKLYMENEAFLSDYWKYSDLENEAI